MSRLFFVGHAVDRYRERWAPHLSFSEARRELELLGQGARPEKQRSCKGQELWVANSTEKILFVVKRDRGERVCVTVLPFQAGEVSDLNPDFEEFLEYQREREEDEQRAKHLLVEERRSRGLLCDECHLGEVTRYSRKLGKKLCDGCYTSFHAKMGRTGLGKCPLIQDWEARLKPAGVP